MATAALVALLGIGTTAYVVGRTAYVVNHPHPTPSPSPTTAPVAGDPCGGDKFCVLNYQVTQATIHQTICVPGWTKTVRPPVTYTDSLKQQQIQQLNLPGILGDYEEDHRVPLELGGSPSAPHNLTPEPHTSSSQKDHDENVFKGYVCSGQKTLEQAQREFINKWLGPWPTYRQ